MWSCGQGSRFHAEGQGIARNGVYEVLGELDASRRDGEAWLRDLRGSK
ncbi:MAG: hypothetical protein KDN22_05560 [Verrucomicrobiae bacterium]|nr:hypothetical protein [Verrucomicrobiae bacterium]